MSELDSMEAGEQLDVLVAIEVMGWEWVQALALGCNVPVSPDVARKHLPEFRRKNPEWEDRCPQLFPPYSTDETAMFTAVDSLPGISHLTGGDDFFTATISMPGVCEHASAKTRCGALAIVTIKAVRAAGYKPTKRE